MAGGVSRLPGKLPRGDITEKTAGQRDFLRMHIPEGFAAAAWRKRYVPGPWRRDIRDALRRIMKEKCGHRRAARADTLAKDGPDGAEMRFFRPKSRNFRRK